MIAPISAADVKAGFRSGVHALDDYLRRHAFANDRAGISRCFVLRPDVPEPVQIAGYYTLSMAAVQADALRAALRDRLPRYPLPVALIGRLAVDERCRGRRFGEWLVVDALTRVAAVTETLGCVGVIVDAKDEGAERFYWKYDFVSIEEEAWPRRMFLPIATARAAIGHRTSA
jgi:ribosomal protein S18 acetylase RimI-like enzyme